MKFSIVFLAVAALVSGRAWADNQEPAVNAGGAVLAMDGQAAGASRGDGGRQIPVQKRASTKFADGRLDEYIVFQYDQGDVLLLSQSRYSASGVLVETVEFTYENGRAVRKITRDEQGRPHSMISYRYNPQGLISGETLADRNGRTLSSYEYQYDANGNRVVRIINNTRGGKLAETSFAYRNGLLVSTETRDGTGRKTGSSENTYDGGGNRVTERVFDARGDVVRIVNASWRNGLEATLERADAAGRVLLRETYEYGSYDELVRKTIEDIHSGMKKIIEYEYTFREEQRP
ncbi:MAG: hypothetical protein LBK40_07865 [Spirochaetaceae bacterium]|nr:hypothetical protein [Spirochaetaceae bacterium]